MLDETEVGLGEGFEANGMPDVVLKVVELVRLGGKVERQLPVTREPLDPGLGTAGLRSETFVPACRGLRLDLLEQRASSIQVALAGKAPAQRRGRALVVLELKPQPLLDLHAALDKTRSEVAGAALRDGDVPNHNRYQGRVTNTLGLLERRAGIDECRVDVCLEDPHPAPVPEDPRLSDLVPGGIGERLVQVLDRRLRVGSERRGQLEQNI